MCRKCMVIFLFSYFQSATFLCASVVISLLVQELKTYIKVVIVHTHMPTSSSICSFRVIINSTFVT